MQRASILAYFLCAISVARADTFVGGEVRAQAFLTATDDVMFGARAHASHRWDDRWELGVMAGGAIGDRANHLFVDALGEAALWVHPSTKLDLELGARVGYAYIHLSYGAEDHALVIEPLIALQFRLGTGPVLVVEPFLVSLYDSGPWQAMIGPQVGLRWRL